MSTGRVWMRVAVCAALLGVAACQEDCGTTESQDGGRDAAAVDCLIDDSYDFQSAVDLAPGQVLDGTICPQGFDDRDYFRVTTGANDRIIDIRLWNDTGYTNVDLRAAILNADGTPTPMAFSNPDGAGAATDVSASFGVAPGTTYIIEVSDEGGDEGDPANPYHIEIRFSPEPDASEPNNAWDSPAEGRCDGTPHDAYLATRGDQDYFKCTAGAAPARLKLAFSAGAELGWQPKLTVTNDEGQSLLNAELVPREDGSYEYQAAVAVTRYVANATNPDLSETFAHTGDVIVLVEDIDGNRYNFDTTTGRYSLTISTDTGPSGDTEPATRNDTPGTATQIGNGTHSGYLSNFGDVDWYRVNGASGTNVLEIQLDMPADGYIPEGVDPDRVGVNLTVYDARVHLGGGLSVVTGCTQGPANAANLVRCDNWTPDPNGDCDDAHGDQLPICLPGSFCGEMRQSFLVMQGADQNRVPMAATHRTGVAVLVNQPIFIAVSHFQGNIFQEGQPYSLRVNMAPDPDSNEPNDLPPALNREARYSSPSGAIRECNENVFGAVNIGGYSGPQECSRPEITCPREDGGAPDTCNYSSQGGSCLPWVDSSDAWDGGPGGTNPYIALDCSSAGSGSYSGSGYLSYVGDRDYFIFNLPPGDLEVNVDVSSSTGTSGLEMGVFVFTSTDNLHGSYVDADIDRAISTQTCTDWRDCCVGSDVYACERDERPCIDGNCRPPSDCASHNECPPDYLCIRERCFSDTPSHAAPNFTFGPDGGQCLMAPLCSEGNPWVIEITDNGQNDYDLALQYTVTVRWSCNCPTRCSYCTAPLTYRSCESSSR